MFIFFDCELGIHAGSSRTVEILKGALEGVNLAEFASAVKPSVNDDRWFDLLLTLVCLLALIFDHSVNTLLEFIKDPCAVLNLLLQVGHLVKNSKLLILIYRSNPQR